MTIGRRRRRAQIDRPTARRIARDLVADLRPEARRSQRAMPKAGQRSGPATWLAGCGGGSGRRGRAVVVPTYRVERMRLTLEPGEGQGPPIVVATLHGTRQLTPTPAPADGVSSERRRRFRETFELRSTTAACSSRASGGPRRRAAPRRRPADARVASGSPASS